MPQKHRGVHNNLPIYLTNVDGGYIRGGIILLDDFNGKEIAKITRNKDFSQLYIWFTDKTCLNIYLDEFMLPTLEIRELEEVE